VDPVLRTMHKKKNDSIGPMLSIPHRWIAGVSRPRAQVTG
jgi:hypothetical protein